MAGFEFDSAKKYTQIPAENCSSLDFNVKFMAMFFGDIPLTLVLFP